MIDNLPAASAGLFADALYRKSKCENGRNCPAGRVINKDLPREERNS